MNINEIWNEHGDLIIFSLITLAVAFVLTRISRVIISKKIAKAKITGTNATSLKFIRNSIAVVIYLIAIILIIYRMPGGEAIAVSVFASAGLIAAIIGFASQAAFSNIVSGIFIVLFKPFRVGDPIRIGMDIVGAVEDITLRHTVIKDLENRRIIIPNSVISNQTVVNGNLVDERICRHVEFAIGYDSDVDLARKIIQEEAMKHPMTLDARTEEEKAAEAPVVKVLVIGWGDSGVRLRAQIWSNNSAESWEVFTSLMESVKKRFAEADIEIPFPHRKVLLHNMDK